MTRGSFVKEEEEIPSIAAEEAGPILGSGLRGVFGTKTDYHLNLRCFTIVMEIMMEYMCNHEWLKA